MSYYMNKGKSFSIWDIAFLFWGITDSVFNHSVLGMIGQILFYVVSFAYCIKSVRFKISYILLVYLLFCFICWLNIQLGYSIAPHESYFMLQVLLRNLVFLFFFLQFISFLDYDKLMSLYIIYCLLSSLGLLLLNYMNTGTLIMRGVDESINGNIQAINDSIAIGWILLDRGKRNKFKSISLVLFFTVFCLLAGTKKAFIGTLIIVSVYVFLSNPKKIVKNVLFISALLIIVYYLIMKVPVLYNLIGNRFESFINFFQETESDGSTYSRNHYIEIGLRQFRNSPLWGHGINTFKELPESYGTYSHNNYIELLYSVGVIGTFFFYLLYLIPLFANIKRYFSHKTKRIAFTISLTLCCLLLDFAFVSYYERATIVRVLILLFLSGSFMGSYSKPSSSKTDGIS